MTEQERREQIRRALDQLESVEEVLMEAGLHFSVTQLSDVRTTILEETGVPVGVLYGDDPE